MKWDEFLQFVKNEASDEDKNYLNELLDLINQDQEKAIARRYYGNSSLISQAKTLYRNAVEREKIDAERKPGYQDRDQERMINRIKRLSYSFDPRVDRAIFKDRVMAYKDIDLSLIHI